MCRYYYNLICIFGVLILIYISESEFFTRGKVGDGSFTFSTSVPQLLKLSLFR